MIKVSRDTFISIVLVVIGLLLAFLLYQHFFSVHDKVGYVVSVKLYEKYEGKIEIEKKIMKTQTQSKLFYDSLQLELQYLQKAVEQGNADKSTLEQKYEKYGSMYRVYQSTNQEEMEKFNKQIWNQINEYVKQYGKENGYSFIYGATGDGGIMYADSKSDITDDVLKYINKKYEGK